MVCPVSGKNQAFWSRDSDGDITFQIWSTDSKWVSFSLNMQDEYNSGLNAVIHPTMNNYYYYFLPCSLTLNDYQKRYYAQYCYNEYGTYDKNRIVVTKGYFDASQAFYPQVSCNFVLSDSLSLMESKDAVVVEEPIKKH